MYGQCLAAVASTAVAAAPSGPATVNACSASSARPSAGLFWGRLCESLHEPRGTAWIERPGAAMSTEFTPIFLFVLVAVGIALSMIIASAVLGPKKATRVKQMPYESGMNPFGDARQRFDVRYYLIAIVFLLFDVELLFLYPWAVAQWSKLPPQPAAAKAAAGAAAQSVNAAMSAG